MDYRPVALIQNSRLDDNFTVAKGHKTELRNA